MDAFNLVARLTLDTSEYDEALGRAHSSASGFVSDTTAISAGMTTIQRAMSSAAEHTSNAVQGFETLGDAIQATASDTTALSDGAYSVSDSLSESVAVASAATESISGLGESLGDTAGQTSPLAESLSGLYTEIERTTEGIGGVIKGSSEMSEHIQSLANRISLAESAYENAREKVVELTRAFNESAAGGAATAEETQRLAAELTAAEDALEQAGRSADGLQREYDELTQSADDANDKLNETEESAEKAGKGVSKLGDIFKTVGKTIGIATAAAATGAAVLVKQSTSAYAEYEQLVGGVETLFSDLEGTVSAAPTVLENAANAYKTAGMSANQYMDTVTSFSAALIAGLEGDYQKAAEVSDMAITDMADNANKMGTTMESIQNAYQGFAKQNYTMLDNLKLGYGGTKSEMERLLADAQKFSGVEYDISNLSDVYEAIHVIQQEMGITGTTAEEAAETISGSFGSLSASWQNLLTGLADGNADLSGLIDNVVDAAMGTLDNLVPVVEQAVGGLGTLVEAAAPVITDKLPALIDELLPPLLETATSLVESVVSALPPILGTIVDVLPDVITDITTTLISLAPKLTGVAVDLVVGLASGIGQAAPQLVTAAVEAVKEMTTTLTKPDTLKEILNAGLELVTGLAQGIGEALPLLADAAVDVVVNIAEFLVDPENLVNVVGAAINIVVSLGEGIVEAIPRLLIGVAKLTKGITDTIINTDWIKLGGDILSGIGEGIVDNMSWVTDAFGGVLETIDSLLGTNLKKWYDDVTKWARDAGAQIYQTLHADEIEERNNTSKAKDLETSILLTANDYIRSGMDIDAARDQAINDLVQTAEQSYLYDKYLADTLKDNDLFLDPTEYFEAKQEELENAIENSYVPTLAEDAIESINQQNQQYAEYLRKNAEATLDVAKAIGEYSDLGVVTQIGKELDDEQKEAYSLAKEVYAASKEYANRQTKYLSLSYDDQIAMWEKIKDQFVVGSEQYLDAEEEIFDIRQDAIKAQQKLEEQAVKDAEKLQKEQQSAAEKLRKEQEAADKKLLKEQETALKEREKALEEYQKNVEKIYDNIETIEKNYSSALENRTDEIYNSFGLFDEVPERILYSGIDLIQNLQDQIGTTKKFFDDLDTLAGRGVSDALVEEIRSMGVGALDQLDALLDLSEDKLSEYDALFAEKHALAADISESELSGLREEANAEIAEQMTELEALTAENAENLGLTFAEGIAEGIKNGSAEITTAAQNALSSAQNVFGTSGTTASTSYVSTNTADTTNTAAGTGSQNTRTGYNINININGIQYQDFGELVQAISEELQFQIDREARAYA